MFDSVLLALHPLSLIAGISGLILGILFGAMPGLSATLGIALLLPVTFILPADQSLIMLGGVYVGGIFGGSISAVLLNIPGTAASAMTAIEGHPFAKKGDASYALGVATIASGLGGLISAVTLLFASPLLAQFALNFGPLEYIALIVFSLTVVVLLLPTPLFGNAVGAFLGLALATIGFDPFTGAPRFTYGMYQLSSGLPLLPVLIGFFAMPQIILMAWRAVSNRSEIALQDKGRKGSVGRALASVGRHWTTVLRSSGVGISLGILPALGPESTPITAHAMERRFSRNQDTWGKGDAQGLVAAESSNNANVGGSLIPLFALGIPGSAAAAVFIGGLQVHGLQPGPLLFVQNGEIMNTFFASFIIINLLLIILGLTAARLFARVVEVPPGIIATIIGFFAIFGSYAAGNGIFHVYVLMAATVFAMALRLIAVPIVPVTLGLILGGILENQYAVARTSVRSWEFVLERPITLGFAGATVLIVVLVLGSRVIALRSKAEQTAPIQTSDTERSSS